MGSREYLAFHSRHIDLIFDAAYVFAAPADRPTRPEFFAPHFHGTTRCRISLYAGHEWVVGALRVSAGNRARHNQRQWRIGWHCKTNRDGHDRRRCGVIPQLIRKWIIRGSEALRRKNSKEGKNKDRRCAKKLHGHLPSRRKYAAIFKTRPRRSGNGTYSAILPEHPAKRGEFRATGPG